MYQFILFIHVMVAAFIILLVLVQQGKGATLGAAFGSGASQTVFGARGTGSVLYNITMICVGIFFATSLAMNYFATSAYKQAGKMIEVQSPVPVRTQMPQGTSAPVQATVPTQAPVSTQATVPAPTLPVSTQQAPAATKKATPVSSQPASLTDQIPVKK